MQKLKNSSSFGTLLEDSPPMREFHIWFFLILFGKKKVREYTKEKLILASYLFR